MSYSELVNSNGGTRSRVYRLSWIPLLDPRFRTARNRTIRLLLAPLFGYDFVATPSDRCDRNPSSSFPLAPHRPGNPSSGRCLDNQHTLQAARPEGCRTRSAYIVPMTVPTNKTNRAKWPILDLTPSCRHSTSDAEPSMPQLRCPRKGPRQPARGGYEPYDHGQAPHIVAILDLRPVSPTPARSTLYMTSWTHSHTKTSVIAL